MHVDTPVMSLIVVTLLDKRHYLLACGFSGFATSTRSLYCEDRMVRFLIAWSESTSHQNRVRVFLLFLFFSFSSLSLSFNIHRGHSAQDNHVAVIFQFFDTLPGRTYRNYFSGARARARVCVYLFFFFFFSHEFETDHSYRRIQSD